MSTRKKKTSPQTATRDAASQHFSSGQTHRPLSSMHYDCAQQESESAQVFVLVHGAWHGGWCWQKVATLLRAQGHTVYTPTLTGLGERSHLLNPDITLDTFIDDVANLIRWEQLCKVVLVGHSFGGLVISGVADAIPEKIQQLIYLDAFILPHGTSTLDTLPASMVEKMRAAAQQHAIAALPAPSPAQLGLQTQEDQSFIADRLTPQPFSVYESPMRLKNPRIGNHLPCTYVSCTQPAFKGVDGSREWAAAQSNWEMRELETGHLPMISAPVELALLLKELTD